MTTEVLASSTKMITPLIIRSLTIGIITSVLCAIIGVYVVIRKMAFFAHAVSHASLTGVAIAYLANWNPFLTAIGFGVLVGVFVSFLIEKSKLIVDTIIGIILPFSMSIGLILLSFVKGYRPDVMSYLFGDILSTSKADIILVLVFAVPIFILIAVFNKQFLMISLDRDFAEIRGYQVNALDYVFMILVSLVVLLSTKIVGIILVSALVVIPSATAVNIAKDIKQTFVFSFIISIVGVIIGILLSYIFNLPTGPLIVSVISIIFLVSLLFKEK